MRLRVSWLMVDLTLQLRLNAGRAGGLLVAIDRQVHEEDPLSGGATRMVAMDGFDHLLNWKLKVGSHAFPGKDGGTCINEAALVAAGFEYRSISAVEEMP